MSLTKGKINVPSSVKRRNKVSKAGKPSAHTHLQIPEMKIDESISNPSILEDPVVLPSKRVLDAIGERQNMRKRKEVTDELENVKLRMDQIFSRLQDKEEYFGVLKSLYEAAGEVPPRFIMIHLGLNFLPSTVPPDEIQMLKAQMLSSSDKCRSVLTHSEVLNQCFQEIWRLRYQRKYDVLQGLSDAEERGDFQYNLLIQLSNWLEYQNEKLCDSLDMACSNSDTQKLEDALETQMRLCVKYLTTAFQQTKKVSDELLHKFHLLTRERSCLLHARRHSLDDTLEIAPNAPSADEVKSFKVIPVQSLLKNKSKWDWASKKTSDLLTLAARHTRNPNLHTALVTGTVLYANMMKAAQVHIDALPSEEKAIRKGSKKLEEMTQQVAKEKQLLHNAKERNKDLNTQIEELKKANKDAQEICEQLSEKIRLLSGSLTKTKQETVKGQRKVTVEKMQQEEASTKKREELTTEEDIKDPEQDKLIDSALQHLQETVTLKGELIELSKEVATKLMQTGSEQLHQMETMQPDSLSRVLLSIPTQSNVETRESIIQRLQSSIYDLEHVLEDLKEDVGDLEDNINRMEDTNEGEMPESQFSGKDLKTVSKTAISQLTLSSIYSSQHVQWMETVRSDCIETLKALAQFASGMSSMLNDFGARVLARRMQIAKTNIIKLQLHRQTVIRDISAGIDEFFSEVKATIAKFFFNTQPHEAEMMSQRAREESCQMMMHNIMRYKSKIFNLEEQYRTLFFMHMRLCEVAREQKKTISLEDFRQPEEMATDVNQKMEKWLSLKQALFNNDLWIAARQVKTNYELLTKAYLQKKLSQKCVQTGYNAFQEIFDIFDEKMACLVKLCYLKSQLPQIDELMAKMRKKFSKDISRQSNFEKYRQAHYNRVMDKVNAAKSRMQELQRAKQEQMYNVWVVVSQILLETGVLLICPRPKGMTNMEKYDKALKTVIKQPYVPLVNPENIQYFLDKSKLSNARSRTAADNLQMTTLSLDTKTVTAEGFIPRGFAYKPTDEDKAEFLSRKQSAQKEEADAKTNDREQDVFILRMPSNVSMYNISHGWTDMEGEETETKEM